MTVSRSLVDASGRPVRIQPPPTIAAASHESSGRGGEVICRPWIARNKGAFPKAAFHINVRDLTITCPASAVERPEFGSLTEFDPEF